MNVCQIRAITMGLAPTRRMRSRAPAQQGGQAQPVTSVSNIVPVE